MGFAAQVACLSALAVLQTPAVDMADAMISLSVSAAKAGPAKNATICAQEG